MEGGQSCKWTRGSGRSHQHKRSFISMNVATFDGGHLSPDRAGWKDLCPPLPFGSRALLRSKQFAIDPEARQDQDDQRPGHGAVEKSPHFSTPVHCKRSAAAQRTGSSFAFLEYVGDALNHLRIDVPDVVARLLFRNSRFARAVLMPTQ
jgi:hypothetical protein